MWCVKCKNDLSQCTCDDIEERLAKVSATAPFAWKRCKKCGMHYARCKCQQPEWEVVRGTLTPLPNSEEPKAEETPPLSWLTCPHCHESHTYRYRVDEEVCCVGCGSVWTPKPIAPADEGEEKHPEDTCQRCGRDNPTWYAENELWNSVILEKQGIICPICFKELAQERGVHTALKCYDMRQGNREAVIDDLQAALAEKEKELNEIRNHTS